MERLVQDLLEVQLLEDGRRAIRRTTLSVESTLDEAVRGFEQTALTKSIGLERMRVEGRSGDDWSIKGDRDRLLEVLSNLLDNAMKFTDPGGRIRIGAELREDEAIFFVSDTGVGIAPEHVPHLFDRYVQAHEKRRAGAGLGLAIAKEIVEGHGGSIWCESEPGQGSSFSFSIPVG
jgi:signal transduction histidine kinase